jgi:cyclohexa-1,5-dienecarbonyl-CoA hydratase
MILVEKNERVLHLKLNIPPVNVIDTAACKELSEKLKEASRDETIAAIILSGEGKCFSAGASVEEHEEKLAADMLPAFADACQALYEMPVPTAALVHGFCFGGALELVLYADFIVADPSAKFSVPEITLAFFPPLACSALPGVVGRQNAAHLIFTGETVDAERAYAMGLVQKIAEQSQWEKVAKRFNKTSAPVLRLAKQAFKQGLKTPVDEVHGEIVKDLFLNRLYKIEDVNEGIASFREKRKPEWKHR